MKLTRLERRSALIGMVLGDANLMRQRHRTTGTLSHANIRFNHSAKQRAYLEWKLDLIQPMFDYPLAIQSKYVTLGDKQYPVVWLYTRVNPQLTTLYKWFYDPITGTKRVTWDILERLDDRGVAIWYMDDGGFQRETRFGKGGGQVRLATDSFTLAENELIRDWFCARYDVEFRLHYEPRTGRYSLVRGVSEAHKLLDAIAPHVPECMRYKVTYTPPMRPNGWYQLPRTVPGTPLPATPDGQG